MNTDFDNVIPAKAGIQVHPPGEPKSTKGRAQARRIHEKLPDARPVRLLICHALSGNAHVAGYHSESDKKPGWWETMVGPGKGIDTDKYFVICSNFLTGCAGTTGPSAAGTGISVRLKRVKRPRNLQETEGKKVGG